MLFSVRFSPLSAELSAPVNPCIPIFLFLSCRNYGPDISPSPDFFCTQKAPMEPRMYGTPGAFAKSVPYCRIDGSQVAISGTKQRRTISRAIIRPKGADP